MKILFISSGNSKFGIIPFIKSQGDSLINQGIELEYYTIKGTGYFGYLRHIVFLRKFLGKNKFDMLHAHYSLSAFVTSIASIGKEIPLIVSLMGSDTESTTIEKFFMKFFNRISWNRLIVKSDIMKKKIGIDLAEVIPNGVNLDIFKEVNKIEARTEVGFELGKKVILFAANPKRYSKHFELAENALKLLNKDDIDLRIVYSIEQEEIPKYINATDILLLTSRYEGSPNIIKEAMACNCPIVSTNVGDVEWLFGDEPGHFLTTFEPQDVADKIKLALKFAEEKGRTNGRVRIIELGLDSETVAKKIISNYKIILKHAE